MKPNTKKILILAAACIALYGLAYGVGLLIVRLKEKRAISDHDDINTGSTNSESQAVMPVSPLKWGSGIYPSEDMNIAKNNVRQLQKLCNKWAGTGIVIDGQWGNNTEKAVQRLRDATVIPKGNDYYFGAKHPFYDYIKPVQVPLNGQSQVQIMCSHLQKMIAWHNDNVGQYRPA